MPWRNTLICEKILDSGDPFPKLFFFGVTQKDNKIDCTKIVMFSILVKDCSFKKMTASKNQRCKT